LCTAAAEFGEFFKLKKKSTDRDEKRRADALFFFFFSWDRNNKQKSLRTLKSAAAAAQLQMSETSHIAKKTTNIIYSRINMSSTV
jgi:hypothetical protein